MLPPRPWLSRELFAGAPASPRRRNLAKLHGFLARAMIRRFATLALALLFVSAAAQADAQGYSRAAETVLSRAFAASGGQGWYMLRGWHETGRQGGVAYEAWIDPVRYGLRVEHRQDDGLRIHGFNGQADWQVAPDGAVIAVNDAATLAQARTEAFFAANCFFFRGRFDAKGDYVGVRSLGGRAYEVVRIQPWGGEPRELWFDRSTHMLTRIVDRRRGHAVRVSDYRKVGPVRVAFRYAPEGASPPALARERDEVAFPPADRDRFSLNRPKDLARVESVRKER